MLARTISQKMQLLLPLSLLLATSILQPSSRSAQAVRNAEWEVPYGGFLGRLDPTNGRVTEIPMPGGPASLPYGMGKDDKGRLWVTESGRNGAVLHAFDPKTGQLWFGTDQGTIGRAEVSPARIAM